jgi:3-oxoacyl-[acyl-carrier protein] reductase
MAAGDARVAIVSGGSRGIGRASVLALARDGFDVSFCFHSDEQAAWEVEKDASAFGVRVRAMRVDVSHGPSVREWVAGTEEQLGGIEFAVAAAGITRDGPLVSMSDDDWSEVVKTNLGGVYHLCRAVVFPMMKRRSGSIVTISSVAGVHGNAGQTNYSATKAGIIGFSKALAKEVARHGVRVNVVAPGFIDTDMTAVLGDKVKERVLQSIPLRRLGTAEEVAELVCYLASSRAAYVTGSVLQIDGGVAL